MKDLCNIDSSLKQVVKKPTRKKNILDVILTNLHSFYQEPEIIPAIEPDVIGKGEPSDHSGVLMIQTVASSPSGHKETRYVRPIADGST